MSLFRKRTPIPDFPKSGETPQQNTNNATPWDSTKDVPFTGAQPNQPEPQPTPQNTPEDIPGDAPEHFFKMVTDPEDNVHQTPVGITLLDEKAPAPEGATPEQIAILERERQERKLMGALLTNNLDYMRSPDIAISDDLVLDFYSKINSGKITLEQEYDIVKRISPNWLQESTNLFSRGIKFGAPSGLAIIGYMNNGPAGLTNWQQVDLNSYFDFTKKYPDAISFDKPASEFLDMLKFVQSPKLEGFTRSMEKFKHTVYGEQQEYLDAVKSLNDKAVTWAKMYDVPSVLEKDNN